MIVHVKNICLPFLKTLFIIKYPKYITNLSYMKTGAVCSENRGKYCKYGTQRSNTCLPEESMYEQPVEGNAKGENVTSTPGAITKGMIVYPHQAGTSSDIPTKLRKRSASSSSSEISYGERKKAKSEATVLSAPLPG
jgi:hypothetical protein